MNKSEFLQELQNKLSALPPRDKEEHLSFYSEMIDDRMEDGATEEEAVAGVGTADDAAAQILAETPLFKLVKEKVKPKRKLRAWEIALIALGFPVWFPLLIAAGAILLSVYLALWSLILSLWAAEAAIAVSAVAGVLGGAFYALAADGALGLLLIAAGLLLSGLSVFLYFGCKEATKGALLLAKKAAYGMKKQFIRKEETV